MGFRTQRMANDFPLWTKVRKDPSSVGQRLFSVFSELVEEQTITHVKYSQDMRLLKHYLGVGTVWGFSLDDDDLYPENHTTFAVSKYTYPTVVGTLNAVDITCTRMEEVVGFLAAPPDRLISAGTGAYSSMVCWSSGTPYTTSSPPWPERLCVVVQGSTFYAKRSKYQDRQYTGRHVVQIVGTDENDVSIREYVEVADDGTFYTRNIFKTVDDVILEGFSGGTTTISWFAQQNPFEVDPYRQAVFDDFEGQLRLSLSTQVVDAVTYSYVEYTSARLKLGEEYRRPSIEAPDNTEILAEVVLLDSSGDPYTAVDLAINHETSKLYVLDAQGRLQRL